MGYLEERKRQEQQEHEARAAEYARLTQREAAGKLPERDYAKLTAAASAIGKNAESVEADLVVWQQAMALEPVAATAEQLRRDRDATREANAAADTEARAIRARLDAEFAERFQAMTEADRKLAVAERASAELAELRGQHWRLLGVADPSIAARKRHVAQILFSGEPRPATCEFVSLEQVMRGPGGHRRLLDLTPDELVPLDGQATDEAAEVLAQMQTMIHADHGQRCRYLLHAVDAPKVRCNSDLVMYADAPGTADASTYRFATNEAEGGWLVSFVRAPGQTDGELEELKNLLRLRLGRERKHRRDDEAIHNVGGTRKTLEVMEPGRTI